MHRRAVRTIVVVGAVCLSAGTLAACSSSSSPSKSSSTSGGAASSSATSRPTSAAPSGSASGGSGTSLSLPAYVVHTSSTTAAYLAITFAGRKYLMLVDTGAAQTIIDTSVVRAARYKIVKRSQTQTIGCRVQSAAVQVDRWSIGGRALPTTPLLSQNLGYHGKKIGGVPIGGTLGADQQVGIGTLTIDYRGKKIVLGGPTPTGAKSVPLTVHKLAGNTVAASVPVTIGSAKASMQLDTGASVTTIRDSDVARLKLRSVGKTQQINALGCPASVKPVELAHARVGDVTLPTTLAVGTTKGSPALPDAIGLLGANVFYPFGSITVDYKNATLYLGGS